MEPSTKKSNSYRSTYIKQDEVRAYSKLCELLSRDSKDLFVDIEEVHELAPLETLIKKLTTMIDLMAPTITAPIMNTNDILQYYLRESEKILEHEQLISDTNYWIMKLDYEERHKND